MSNKVLAYYYIAGPRRNTLVDDEVRNREKQGEGAPERRTRSPSFLSFSSFSRNSPALKLEKEIKRIKKTMKQIYAIHIVLRGK